MSQSVALDFEVVPPVLTEKLALSLLSFSCAGFVPTSPS